MEYIKEDFGELFQVLSTMKEIISNLLHSETLSRLIR